MDDDDINQTIKMIAFYTKFQTTMTQYEFKMTKIAELMQKGCNINQKDEIEFLSATLSFYEQGNKIVDEFIKKHGLDV